MKEEILNKILSDYNSPLYVFDINVVKERIKYLKSFFNQKVLLCFAIKANTFIVKDIENDIDRLEVCSPGEYEICNYNKICNNKILISGVNKDYDFIKKLIENEDEIGVYTVESVKQFEILKELSTNLSKEINIMIRLTSGNQFGVEEEELENIIQNRNDYKNLNIKGIQYFSGTQKRTLRRLEKELNYIDEYLEKLYKEYSFEAEEFEFGPGFPIHYFETEDFEEEEFISGFSELLCNMKFKGKIVLELGRSISASCGSYITKVIDKKTNKSQNYAILDGGMNHIVYYGQSMAMKIPKYEIYPKRDDNNANIENWNLCGSLCTTNDILVKQLPVSNLQIGDFFVFENTGAYCMTEGISLFLSRDLPRVIKLTKNEEIVEVRDNIPTYKLNM